MANIDFDDSIAKDLLDKINFKQQQLKNAQEEYERHVNHEKEKRAQRTLEEKQTEIKKHVDGICKKLDYKNKTGIWLILEVTNSGVDNINAIRVVGYDIFEDRAKEAVELYNKVLKLKNLHPNIKYKVDENPVINYKLITDLCTKYVEAP